MTVALIDKIMGSNQTQVSIARAADAPWSELHLATL